MEWEVEISSRQKRKKERIISYKRKTGSKKGIGNTGSVWKG